MSSSHSVYCIRSIDDPKRFWTTKPFGHWGPHGQFYSRPGHAKAAIKYHKMRGAEIVQYNLTEAGTIPLE